MHVFITPALAVAIGHAAPAVAQPSEAISGDLRTGRLQVTTPGCSSVKDQGAIVVCGRRSDPYRIPKEIRERPSSSAPPSSRMALSAEDLAPCGIFQGERRCGKQEAGRYGYGQGRDPVTVAIKLFDALTKPDK